MTLLHNEVYENVCSSSWYNLLYCAAKSVPLMCVADDAVWDYVKETEISLLITVVTFFV